MFRRIVDRISQQQDVIQDNRLRRENDMCLAHVIGIRNGSEDDDSRINNKRYYISDFAPPRARSSPPEHDAPGSARQQQQQQQLSESQPSQGDDEMFVLEF